MLRASVIVAVSLGVVAPLAAQVESAPAQEERRAIAFHRALKSGAADTVVAFLEQNATPEMWSRRDPAGWRRMATQLVQRLGALEIEGVDVMRPHTLNLTLAPANEAGPMATLGFEFEAQAPYRIASLSVELGGPRERAGADFPPFEVPPGADRAGVLATLERYLADLARRDLFSGAALVTHRGEVIFGAAHGLASRRYGVPNRVDTRFDLGSINKAFTKVAIGQLAQTGKLSLTDRLIDRLPDYPNRAAAERITIAQLLEHSSGLGDIFTERFRNSSRALYRTPRDYFPLFADEPLLFEPGQGRQYSNAGYIVLGAVIEAVSGMPYEEYARTRIFEPAGMTRSGFFPRDGITPDVAEGYTRMGGEERRSNVLMLPVVGNAAGSAQSTVGDLARFDAALRTHRLLTPAYTEWFFGGPEPAPGSAAPARSGAPRASAAIGIAGGGPGVSAVLESDGDYALIVLANEDPPMAEAIARRVFGELRRTGR